MKLGLFAGLFLVAACPADDAPEEDGSGSGSGSGSASESDSNSDSVSASGPDSGDPPADCEDLAGPMLAEIELRLDNERPGPIFIDTGCGPALLLSQAGGMASFNPDTCDAPTCDLSLAGDCSTACAACIPGVLRIEPGTSYTQTWPGSIWSRVDVSDVCDLCTTECWQELAAPAGGYELRANVFLECPPSLDSCECPPGTEPPCFIEAYDGAVNAAAFSVDFTMPTAGPVELVID